MYLDQAVDASGWVNLGDADDFPYLEVALDVMWRMGLLHESIQEPDFDALRRLELRAAFRSQLRRVLSIRDTSPWPEKVVFICEWAHPLGSVTDLHRGRGEEDSVIWQTTAPFSRPRPCVNGHRSAGKASCTIWYHFPESRLTVTRTADEQAHTDCKLELLKALVGMR